MKFFLLAVFLLVVEVFVIGSMLHEERVRQTIISEQAGIVSLLGVETAVQIKERADGMYRAAFMDSGLRDATYELLIPNQTEKDRSQSIAEMGRSGFGWAKDRLDVFWTTIYQVMIRLAVMVLWAPFLLIALVPASLDGLLMRAKKRYNMGYASPLKQRVSTLVIIATLYISLLALFAPISMPPLFVPVLGTFIALASGLLLANVQRHL
jgi:hypothetical protein